MMTMKWLSWSRMILRFALDMANDLTDYFPSLRRFGSRIGLSICRAILLTLCAGLCYAACLCPDHCIGAEKEMKPALEVSSSSGEGKLMVCGHPTREYEIFKNLLRTDVKESATQFNISEFDVIDCNSGKFLVTYGARDQCWVESKNHELTITRMTRLPRWHGDWADFTYAERKIRWSSQKWTTGDERLVFNIPKMSQTHVSSLLKDFEEATKAGSSQSLCANEGEFAGLLMIAALNGSRTARDDFQRFKGLCNLNGMIGETYNKFARTLDEVSKGSVSKSNRRKTGMGI